MNWWLSPCQDQLPLNLLVVFFSFNSVNLRCVPLRFSLLSIKNVLTATVFPASCSVRRCAGVDTDPPAFCGPLAPKPWTHSWVSWREVYSSGIRSLLRALAPRTSRILWGPVRRRPECKLETGRHPPSPVSCPHLRAGILGRRSRSVRTEHRSQTRPGTWNCLYPMDCTAGRQHTCHAPPSFLTLFIQLRGDENPKTSNNFQLKKSWCYHWIGETTKWPVRFLRTVRHGKFLQ